MSPTRLPLLMCRWLVGAGVEVSPRVAAVALAGLRVLAGLLWLYNVRWKHAPDFGRSSGGGLYGYTGDAVTHPVFGPYSWLVEHLVLPNFTVFAWMVVVVESALAVLLLTGALVRLAALIGVGQALAIALSVAHTPGEWPWAYAMMIGIHLVLLCTAAGAVASVDAIRAPRTSASAGHLLGSWGILAILVGLTAALLSIGQDPLTPAGPIVGKQSLQIGLGSYNLLGAGLLLAIGALMVTGARLARPALSWAATIVSVLAALTLYAQLGHTDAWLGGTNASAAAFLCTAIIAGTTAPRLHTDLLTLTGRSTQEQ